MESGTDPGSTAERVAASLSPECVQKKQVLRVFYSKVQGALQKSWKLQKLYLDVPMYTLYTSPGGRRQTIVCVLGSLVPKSSGRPLEGT
jgi:hypothetical protein